ncbi:acyltransferase family protein [Asticcacaulis excentricus]|uniref:Acyltransferase 3 n=1 Tax=Asticcacaulis excentricus (strain ATCC 15261 / DSM 4724 / KCTC 12464 / NCIMB 9791 / VKM B-1370 / CB 48) TaxID=573065 RepID=E8RM87_ASTEC|nr:acyltransferase [Asticcacaulis excentricus]ADU13838.1 acyltransferase 3 [Asticcacaulis excentricus CB 48]
MQFINNLRGLAILLIVATHAVSTLPSLGLIGEFIDYFVGGATLLFMAISGYVFQTALPGFRYLPYLKSKAIYVGVPYLVLSLPANLLYVLGLKGDHPWIDMAAFAQMGVLEKCVLLVFTGAGLGPLWFIPMIGIFYLAAPLFSGLSRLKLVLPAFILACGLAVWVGRPPLNDQPFQAFIFFIPAYLLGMLLSANKFTLERSGSTLLPIFCAYLIAYGLAFIGLKLSGITPDRTGTMLFYLPIIVLLFGVFQQFFRRKDIWLDLFARLSFFIFFIHGYFAALIRSVFAKLVDGNGSLYPVLEVPLIVAAFVSMLALSILTYLVLKLCLRERSRLIIGG